MNEPHIEMKNTGFPKNEFRFPDRIHLSEQDKMAIVMQDILNETCGRNEEFMERINEMAQPHKPGILSRMRQWLAQRRSRKIALLRRRIESADISIGIAAWVGGRRRGETGSMITNLIEKREAHCLRLRKKLDRLTRKGGLAG